MPTLPIIIDAEALRRGLAEDIVQITRSLHSMGHVLVRRDTDNHIAEVVAVALTIFISMGALMYWGIVKEGSCTWRSKK